MHDTDQPGEKLERQMSYLAAPDRYERMQYRRSGRSGLQLPELSLGLWNNFGDDFPFESGRAIVRRAFDLGITHFDLADNYGPPYGSAEENFGRLLRHDFGGYRDELVISTKAGYDMWPGPYGDRGSRKYLLASLDQSLGRLGLDYVDIFYSHRFDPDTPLEETLAKIRALNEIAVRRGQSLAQTALAWVLRDPRVTSALVGASSVAQLETNVAALDRLDFTDDELAEIDRYATESEINIWAESSRT